MQYVHKSRYEYLICKHNTIIYRLIHHFAVDILKCASITKKVVYLYRYS